MRWFSVLHNCLRKYSQGTALLRRRRSQLLLVGIASLGFCCPVEAATNYYVDCSASTNGNGTLGSPWNQLSSVNSHAAFQPGDAILFKRAMTCSGNLHALGSGNGTGVGQYITLDAYGTGARPIISASTTDSSKEEAIELFNQQYWHLNNLEAKGGYRYVVNINGDESTIPLKHIYFTNCTFHDSPANPVSSASNDPALVSISQKGTEYADQAIQDVLLDGVTVYQTTPIPNGPGNSWLLGNGIYASAENITIRNSTIHDVRNSGIVVLGNASRWPTHDTNLLYDTNVVHDIGTAKSLTLDGVNDLGGGIGMWEFECLDCTIQSNESYNTTDEAFQGDGGTFDLDYHNKNNTYQYNYGHDADGYCISAFAAHAGGTAPDPDTENSIIRYNICSNNNLGPDRWAAANPPQSFPTQPDIFVYAWDNVKGGTNNKGFNGLQIYNNTIYHNPSKGPNSGCSAGADGCPDYALGEQVTGNEALYVGTRPDFFENNLIYSTVNQMILTIAPISGQAQALNVDFNLYWCISPCSPSTAKFTLLGTSYTGWSNYQNHSGEDQHSQFVDPLLNNPTYHGVGRPTNQFTPQTGSWAIDTGTDVCIGISGCTNGGRDFLGTAIPQHVNYDVGAIEVVQ